MATLPRPEPIEESDFKAIGDLRSTAFPFLWGMFMLLHQAMTYDRWISARGSAAVLSWAVFLGALLVVRKPSSLGRFAVLLAASIALEWVRLPFLPNHMFFAFSVSITALSVLAWRFLASGRDAGPAPLQIAMALIRCEVLIMYFFVVFHKINYDYFNVDVSCSVSMYREIVKWLPFMPTGSWVYWPTIVGVFLLEALIPILLAIPKTRVLGAGVGMAFHYLLSLHPNRYVYSYSAMMFALFTLFLPEDFLADAWAKVERISLRRLAGIVALGVGSGVAVLMSGLVVNRTLLASRLGDPVSIGVRLTWLVLGLTAMALHAATLLGGSRVESRRLARGPASGEPSLFRPAVSWMIVFPALVFLNGFCPYLGLKTESAFAMFSNLRTEGGRTNHAFMPIRYHLAGYQEDLAEIIDSSDGFLMSLSKQNLGIPYFGLRHMVSGTTDPNFTLAYIRNGRQFQISRRADPSAELFRPNPWPLNKLLNFRPVQLGPGPQKCVH